MIHISFFLRHWHQLIKRTVKVATAHILGQKIGLLCLYSISAPRWRWLCATNICNTCITVHILVEKLRDYFCFEISETQYEELFWLIAITKECPLIKATSKICRNAHGDSFPSANSETHRAILIEKFHTVYKHIKMDGLINCDHWIDFYQWNRAQ